MSAKENFLFSPIIPIKPNVDRDLFKKLLKRYNCQSFRIGRSDRWVGHQATRLLASNILSIGTNFHFRSDPRYMSGWLISYDFGHQTPDDYYLNRHDDFKGFVKEQYELTIWATPPRKMTLAHLADKETY